MIALTCSPLSPRTTSARSPSAREARASAPEEARVFHLVFARAAGARERAAAWLADWLARHGGSAKLGLIAATVKVVASRADRFEAEVTALGHAAVGSVTRTPLVVRLGDG